MTPRFAVRWTLIGLLAAFPLLALAYILSLLQSAPQPAPQSVSVNDLLSAVEMRLDANGTGTQIISETILTLRLQPYPVRSSDITTVTLVALTSNGKFWPAANPTLWVTQSSAGEPRAYPMSARPEGSYSVAGKLLPSPGQYRMRVDVYLGDDMPANLIFTLPSQ